MRLGEEKYVKEKGEISEMAKKIILFFTANLLRSFILISGLLKTYKF